MSGNFINLQHNQSIAHSPAGPGVDANSPCQLCKTPCLPGFRSLAGLVNMASAEHDCQQAHCAEHDCQQAQSIHSRGSDGSDGNDWGDGCLNSPDRGEEACSVPANPGVSHGASSICQATDTRQHIFKLIAGFAQSTERHDALLRDTIESRNSSRWPMTQHDIPVRPAPPASYTLVTQSDDTPPWWRRQRRKVTSSVYTDVSRTEAFEFFEWWGCGSDLSSEDITDSLDFCWRGYLQTLSMRREVIGKGINKFFIAEVPKLSDPEHRTRSLVAFIVLRSDGSQVRIQPYSDRDPTLLYVDQPGPNYYGHIASLTEWPSGSRRCEGLLFPVTDPNAMGSDFWNASVTTDHWKDLHDTVTNAEAIACLNGHNLAANMILDLSDGTVFPWVLWVRNQIDIMKVIRLSRGVNHFSLVVFHFHWDLQAQHISARAFRLEMLLSDGPKCLLLFPLPSEVVVVEIEPHIHPAMCCFQNPTLQQQLATEFSRDRPREPVQPTYDHVPWDLGRLAAARALPAGQPPL